jgi:hypothetical protein
VKQPRVMVTKRTWGDGATWVYVHRTSAASAIAVRIFKAGHKDEADAYAKRLRSALRGES